ncbi:MAG: hypothetical protein OEW67_05380 [Cyclobacteriaceae bacterium]|nr:hypothetical protein [Cyclobacteriaceae bacterium]
MFKNLLLLSFSILLWTSVWAQSTFIPNNKDYYHLVNRYEIRNGELSQAFHSSFRTYKRKNVANFTDSMEVSSKADQFNQEYLRNDNWEWVENHTNVSKKPFLKYFYRSKSDLYHVQSKNFDLHVNPVLDLSYGTETANSNAPYINTRGVEIRSMIDKKVGFYSFIGENQARFPEYVRQNILKNGVVPHEGFWKKYDNYGVDFFTVRGYVTFNATKNIDLQFGHDNFFIGNGYRSLLLSDYAPSFTFLRINTQVWKFKYTNVYGQLTADAFGNSGGTFGSGGFPNKYIALHHLSLNIGKKFNLGLYESVIFGKELNNNYELKYLNPVIFYRAIEHQNGSSDNVLVGLDMKWLVLPKVSIYGQLILDEFLLNYLKEGQGWWGNKYGVQAGLHYVNAFGVPNLDIQGEYNLVRPYTYSHSTIYNNYVHYRQPLAHPNGANFKEVVGILRYQPIPKLTVVAKGIYNIYGADSTGVNWGGDVLKDYNTREQEFKNDIGQGISNTLMLFDFTLTYQFKHNLFIDLKQVIRNNESEIDIQDQNTSYTSLALRLNISKRLHDF